MVITTFMEFESNTILRKSRHACFGLGHTLCQQVKRYIRGTLLFNRKSVFVILSKVIAVKISIASYRNEAGCVRLNRSGLRSSMKTTRSGCSSAWSASCVDLEPMGSAGTSRFSRKCRRVVLITQIVTTYPSPTSQRGGQVRCGF